MKEKEMVMKVTELALIDISRMMCKNLTKLDRLKEFNFAMTKLFEIRNAPETSKIDLDRLKEFNFAMTKLFEIRNAPETSKIDDVVNCLDILWEGCSDDYNGKEIVFEYLEHIIFTMGVVDEEKDL